MWVITTTGFYSAVEHKDDPDLIMVRARVKADLQRLRRESGLAFMIRRSQRWADYPYRTTISRADWVQVCAQLAGDVDYTNFKNAVRGNARHNVYLSVWSALRRLEPPRPKLQLAKLSKVGSYWDQQPDGESGCRDCGTYLFRAEKESNGGTGQCEFCERDAQVAR